MPKLTENFVTKLKAPDAGYAIHWDDKVKGFGVRITAAGAIAFIFNYRTRAGRQRRLKIGSPRLTPSKLPVWWLSDIVMPSTRAAILLQIGTASAMRRPLRSRRLLH